MECHRAWLQPAVKVIKIGTVLPEPDILTGIQNLNVKASGGLNMSELNQRLGL